MLQERQNQGDNVCNFKEVFVYLGGGTFVSETNGVEIMTLIF